jgi:hypothetical protein
MGFHPGTTVRGSTDVFQTGDVVADATAVVATYNSAAYEAVTLTAASAKHVTMQMYNAMYPSWRLELDEIKRTRGSTYPRWINSRGGPIEDGIGVTPVATTITKSGTEGYFSVYAKNAKVRAINNGLEPAGWNLESEGMWDGWNPE